MPDHDAMLRHRQRMQRLNRLLDLTDHEPEHATPLRRYRCPDRQQRQRGRAREYRTRHQIDHARLPDDQFLDAANGSFIHRFPDPRRNQSPPCGRSSKFLPRPLYVPFSFWRQAVAFTRRPA
ncbi:hypothetical protein [Sphingomonas bacterium]|uniref:hypothetical protein n=1 Tax=Sphingomonas bacterium TaxID=1895847 RepID=UPI00157750AB|nr:hypothetical protein [Sphingomonas bacterium]